MSNKEIADRLEKIIKPKFEVEIAGRKVVLLNQLRFRELSELIEALKAESYDARQSIL